MCGVGCAVWGVGGGDGSFDDVTAFQRGIHMQMRAPLALPDDSHELIEFRFDGNGWVKQRCRSVSFDFRLNYYHLPWAFVGIDKP